MASLDDLAADYDVFLLDAFGVLNIGETAIPGVVERLRRLRGQGKRMMVLTNAASYPTSELVAKYRRLGYDFAPDEVVSSRDALRLALPGDAARRWGVMIPDGSGLADFDRAELVPLADDPAAYAERGGLPPPRQRRLDHRPPGPARNGPRPRAAPADAWGTPTSSPRAKRGSPSSPATSRTAAPTVTGMAPAFFGKPFAGIYEIAFARLGPVDRSRVVMVGDSLHTDVLGARVAGVAAALVTGWGFWSGATLGQRSERPGLLPTSCWTSRDGEPTRCGRLPRRRGASRASPSWVFSSSEQSPTVARRPS